MDYSQNPDSRDFFGRAQAGAQRGAFDGRMLSVMIARCTNNEDPAKLNRIKVILPWQDEEGEPEQETDWLNQMTLFAGPTDPQRGIEAWGLDVPLPEVHQDVGVFFNCGNPHQGFWFMVPRYSERARSVPRVEKDSKKQFSFRMKLPNGFEFAIETEGSVLALVYGHLRVKAQGNLFASAIGKVQTIGTRILMGATSMIKRISPQMRESHYPTAEDPEYQADLIDAMRSVPGSEDPGIRRPEDLS